jgi:protocatechuate 3,4-dioxygenase beta subunit
MAGSEARGALPNRWTVPEAARERLVSRLDMDLTTPEWALGYRWDIVLRGREATPLEDEEDEP